MPQWGQVVLRLWFLRVTCEPIQDALQFVRLVPWLTDGVAFVRVNDQLGWHTGSRQSLMKRLAHG